MRDHVDSLQAEATNIRTGEDSKLVSLQEMFEDRVLAVYTGGDFTQCQKKEVGLVVHVVYSTSDSFVLQQRSLKSHALAVEF